MKKDIHFREANKPLLQHIFPIQQAKQIKIKNQLLRVSMLK